MYQPRHAAPLERRGGVKRTANRVGASGSQVSPAPAPAPARPLLIVGAGGTLGQAFVRLCSMRGLAAVALTYAELDLADADAVAACIAARRPWAVVNAAGYIHVDDAEHEPDRCVTANSLGPANLATTCAHHDARLLTFSSHLVFDGAKQAPYLEEDQVAPLSVYGRSKVAAERIVLRRLPSALVVRTSGCFGPWDEHNFVARTLRAAARGEQIPAIEDERISPTYVPDLVQSCLDLLIDGERGIWHLANQGAVSWAELGRQAAALAGFDPACVAAVRGASLGRAAPRPASSVLGSARGLLLPPLEQALARYLAERRL